MTEKKTEELDKVLRSTHARDFTKFVEDNKSSLTSSMDAFVVYIKDKIREKGLTQQVVFLKADIPERYGYKLLSGEKKTRQRDVILRICYGSHLDLDETQQVLERYGMPRLYPKNARDALLMIIFNEHPGDIIEVNTMLKNNGFETLRSSGVQE